MTLLRLESSMAERKNFHWVLCVAFTVTILAYIHFGYYGCLLYGGSLPNIWSDIAGKVGLCFSTGILFPIMMEPIYEILERELRSSVKFQRLCHKILGAERLNLGVRGVRMLLVVVVTVMAYFFSDFAGFLSAIRSICCLLLSFVVPIVIHLKLMSPSLMFWQKAWNYCLILICLLFASQFISGPSISQVKVILP